MGIIKNKDAFFSGLKQAEKKMVDCFRTRVIGVIRIMHDEVTAFTPVWSGSALANYQWSIGSPKDNFVDYASVGDPGPTNTMSLGVEPRRPLNQMIADASLLMIGNLSDPFVYVWLTNNDPDIGGLEDGSLPPPPLRQRSPRGMLGLSVVYVLAKIDAGQL